MSASYFKAAAGGAYGVPVMKFTLVYEGELRSNDRPKGKSAVRNQIHPQLEELWRINPTLIHVYENRTVPTRSPFANWDRHHSLDHLPNEWESSDPNTLDLCAPIERAGRKFIPLVRDTYALNCFLKITFLRKEEPGRIYNRGDVDNRLKTFFDGLAIPNADQMADHSISDKPIYCLLEDDRLITGFTVDTHQLLSRPGVTDHYVQLVVEVDVRTAQTRVYNQAFLGG